MNINEAQIGVEVIIGKHTHFDNWNDEMNQYVGLKTSITNIGVFSGAYHRCRVKCDGGRYVWRTRNLRPINPASYRSARLYDLIYEHKLWLQDERNGWQANFSGFDFTNADLSGTDFTEAILSETNFSGANLSRAKLVNAFIDGVDFTGANLSDAYFNQSTIKDSLLGKTDLRGARFFNCDLQGVDLSHADLSEGMIQDSNLRLANLDNAKLHWVDFTKNDIDGASFSSASFFEALVSRCKIDDMFITTSDVRKRLQDYGADIRGMR